MWRIRWQISEVVIFFPGHTMQCQRLKLCDVQAFTLGLERLMRSGRDGLPKHHVELPVKDIQPIQLSRIGQYVAQKRSPALEILTPRSRVMGVPGLCIGKGLKDAKGRLREAHSKPGTGQRLLVYTRVDVPQKLLHLVLLSWLGLEMDVVRLLSGGVVNTLHNKPRMIGAKGLLGILWAIFNKAKHLRQTVLLSNTSLKDLCLDLKFRPYTVQLKCSAPC